MLNDLKMMLGIDEDDTSLDKKLNWIIGTATSRLTVLLGGIAPPNELQHIITEVAIIRFNKIGSEGMKSQGIEGESITFGDDDFAGFTDEIQAFLDSQKNASRGKVRFL